MGRVAKGKREKWGEILGILGRWTVGYLSRRGRLLRLPKATCAGLLPKRLHMHGTSIHNGDISKSTRIHLSVPLAQLSGDMTCISIVTKFKLSNSIIHSANLFPKNRHGDFGLLTTDIVV